ncbi:hypothetical protein Slin15195_G065510 [Septoria linicola]|uniref:Uncharacterized protein n=1 Tax=Septoria linicola TaxID=215465 RepID=A0A9Q9AWH8_9PEZI|nr:hypothetical protein Slin14017_G115850 [Septoria linicola]USW53232.1 hypothetical protein Slin15195_G065510 [Septoria linicola]
MSLPNEDRSTTALSEGKQDASLSGTYAARPGAQDTAPAGISTTGSEHPSTAPFVDSSAPTTTGDKPLSSSVKNSLDSVADQSPSTQSVAEQLPSAQAAADAVKAGASSLLAGISNLALGVNNATADNAAASHPESHKAQDVDDLHIPGAFEDETSDREDIAAVQRGAQSAAQALPSTQAVKETIPGVGSGSSNTASNTSGSITEQVQAGARSVQDQAQQGVEYVKEQLPGQQRQTENERIHKDGTDYIKSQLHNQNINSVGASSTTNQLAGQVPLESRAVPDIVQDSQRQAGGAAPLDESATSIHGSGPTTSQLAGQVPLESGRVPAVVADSQRQAGVSPEAAANPQAVQDKKHLEKELREEVPTANISSVGATSTTNQLTGQVPLELRGVPQVVADSQKRADVSPEASANAEVVREKRQVEQELKREVPEQTSKDNTPVNLGEAVSGGLAAAGAAIASAATSARQTAQEATGTDPVSVLPTSTQRAIDGNAQPSSSAGSGAVPQVVQASQQQAGVSPEASANPEAVREKSQLERELQSEVPRQGDGGITANIGQSVAGGLAATAAAAAGAATYAREKTAETTGTDPVSVLPTSAQQAIDGDRSTSGSTHVPQVVSESQRAAGTGPEAAADPTAVQEKSEMERELKREVPIEPATSGDRGITGTIAGGAAAAGAAAVGAATDAREKTAKTTGTDPVSVLPASAQQAIDGDGATSRSTRVPQVVSESQRAAGTGPEAAANATAVQEKSQVERELKREVPPEPATSGDQGITGAIAGGAAAAGSAAAGAATYARERTAEVTGTDPVSVLPETAQRSTDPSSTASAGLPSRSAADLTHEHRPQTLPQSEITAGEQERGLGEGGAGLSHLGNLNESSSFPRVVGGSSLGGVDLRSGVHNGVVGDHLDDTQSTGVNRIPSRETESESAAPVAHIGSVRNVDLSAGVKNTVVGSGAEEHVSQEDLSRGSGL